MYDSISFSKKDFPVSFEICMFLPIVQLCSTFNLFITLFIRQVRSVRCLFHSHLQYGCQLQGLTDNTTSKPIFILQKKALRLITFNNYQCPSSPLFSDLKILKIFDLVRCLHISFVHKFLNNRLPFELLQFFNFIQLEENHGTRGAKLKLLFVPSYNTITFGNKSFTKTCITPWNYLQRSQPDITLPLLTVLGNTEHPLPPQEFHFILTFSKNLFGTQVAASF